MLRNESLLNAGWVTLKVAFATSCFATVLGTIAGLIMSRFGPFSGRTLFSGMIYAPLVMPEVITGLSLLLIFVAIGLDRGFVKVPMAHITFPMFYVAVLLQAWLVIFHAPLGMAPTFLGGPPAAS